MSPILTGAANTSTDGMGVRMPTETCGQQSCKEQAVYRGFWPGRAPLPLCQSCKDKAESISEAMGFYLHVEPLDDASSPPAGEMDLGSPDPFSSDYEGH